MSLCRTYPPLLALLLAASSLSACGGDRTPFEPPPPTVDRSAVAGRYEVTSLTFDPQGSLPAVDILARLETGNVPELFVSSTQDSLQLVFRDPQGGLIRPVPGAYLLLTTGLRATFADPAEVAKVLLPSTLTLTRSEQSGQLTFTGNVNADTARLFQLVPEWAQEPVVNPLPGQLTVVFTPVQ